MNKIYFSSDLHFSHQKSFLYEPRGFSEVIDMNRQIVKNFNSIVDDNDDLYLLGDLIMSDVLEGFDFLKELKGKIHIILRKS